MKMSPKLILFASISVICSWDYAIGGATVQQADPFDPEESAKRVYKAVKGWGTSESEINKVLCTIPYFQREMIAEAFEGDYKQKLKDRLEEETSGQMKKVYRRLMESRGELLGRDLYDYITGKREDKYWAIVEIFCATNADEKAELNSFYKKTYNKEAIQHMKEIVRNDVYFKVLDQRCSKTYCYDKKMTEKKVQEAAQYLKSIDSATNQEAFMTALEKLYGDNNCIPDIQRVFVQYRSISDKGIDDAVGEALKKQPVAILKAWLALVKSTEDRNAYYADAIQKAVNGSGTDEDSIYRVILQTCEHDLGDINSAYKLIYKESIYSRIKHDFSGDVEGCLKMLLGA